MQTRDFPFGTLFVKLKRKPINENESSIQEEDNMPLVEIHMLEGRTDRQKKALLDGVTEAIRNSLGVPLTSIRVWIREFSPKNYMVAGELYADRKK